MEKLRGKAGKDGNAAELERRGEEILSWEWKGPIDGRGLASDGKLLWKDRWEGVGC